MKRGKATHQFDGRTGQSHLEVIESQAVRKIVGRKMASFSEPWQRNLFSQRNFEMRLPWTDQVRIAGG
jgi:hypothetical protein